ncbi:MAG TPA: SGNH/GDSL hydrolase family protein [Chloroflexota bacterium]|nr:SGNH/GDSL hydrolase family protein [Chloroflexota bacterium]
MKTILCYGDSNTWGYNPATSDRFPPDVRWPGAVRRALGEGYYVIEEGLNGRTTVWDDPIESDRNGKTYLLPCLESHKPLDLILIMLGTNDLKKRFNLSPSDIAQSASGLAELALHSGTGPDGRAPIVVLIAPPPVGPLTDFAGLFESAGEKSQQFSRYYKLWASRKGCAFFDAAEVTVSSPLDGIHFEADEHEKLGRAVAAEVRRLLTQEGGPAVSGGA